MLFLYGARKILGTCFLVVIQQDFFEIQCISLLAYKLQPPQNVSDKFGDWLDGVGMKLRQLLLLGASALCWAICLSRKDVVFDKTSSKSFIEVLHKGTYWLRFQSQLEKKDEGKKAINEACQTLEEQFFRFLRSIDGDLALDFACNGLPFKACV